jgi:hypothetical protein
MKLQGRNLQLGMKGDDVKQLHDELALLDFPIDTDARKKKVFDDGMTLRAVKAVQEKCGLKVTGIVDEATAKAINAEVDARFPFSLHGVVTDANRARFADARIVAFDKDRLGEDKLGETATNSKGEYYIRYSAEQFRRSKSENGGADLIVRVLDAGGTIIATSSKINSAQPEETIDVVIEKKPTPSAERFVVRGQIRQPDGSAAAGVLVRAYDRDLRREEFLAEVSTDRDGRYEFIYRAEQFRRAEKGSADLRVCVVDEKDKELVSSDVLFNAPAEVLIDLALPAEPERRSELELLINSVLPLLKGQGEGGEDLPFAELNEKDIDFLAKDSGEPRERIALLVAAVKASLATAPSSTPIYQSRVSKSNHPVMPPEVLYGWFRQGLPLAADGLWARPVDDLIGALKTSIAQNIIPEAFGKQVEEITVVLNTLKVDLLLKPAAEGQPSSLGDLLGTMPQRLSTEKERIVAKAIHDLPATGDDLAKRLKKAKFDDKEIAAVQVTMALGDLTQNHTLLMKELQTLRTNDEDTSIRYLASRTPLQWLELVDKHGVPGSLSESPQVYAEQLERTVEAKHPTAVFAARVQDNLLELNDSSFKIAANFLVANPELELTRQNVRAYVNNGADLGDVKDKDQEQLVNTLQRIQLVLKLSANWKEAGMLQKNDFNSSLDIVQERRERFVVKAVRGGISQERAEDLYNTAQHVHNTTIAWIGNARTSILGGTFDLFDPTEAQADPVALKDYPNLRKLFGNLDTCECQHCQSVLSPAAYLVDIMRFLDPKQSEGSTPLLALLGRRPDIADLELTCANTKTEIPYIDLVLEVLENAVAFPEHSPIEIKPPYGFDPEVDFKKTPLQDDVVKALRAILGRTAISVGEHLDVKNSDKQLNFTDWIVTDGVRHWVLRHWHQALTAKFAADQFKISVNSLPVTNFGKAIAELDKGKLPQAYWLIPANVSVNDRNLPQIGKPVVTKLEAGRKWKVEYTRFVHVEIIMGGAVILKAAKGKQLNVLQTTSGVLQMLASALNQGRLAEPLISNLPSQLQYHVTKVGNAWDIEADCEATLFYVPQQLAITSLAYQSSGSHEDLKASPENRNPEAYNKLDAAVFPWTLPFNLWLEEVRVFLERRGIPRRQLLEQCNPTSRLLADAHADAIAREVLGLSGSEADIFATTTAQPRWEFWGLKENDNRVIDLNDESTVSGSWIKVLSRVSILLQRSGLSYRELLNVLQTRFVKKVPPILNPVGDECNPSKMKLGLNADHLDRIHRLVRLWRKLGWSIFELDLAISSVTNNSMDLTQATLRGLSHIQRLRELLGLPISVIASWWGTLITASYNDHTSNKRPVIKSVYEQLFLNPTVQNPPNPDFALNQLPSTTKTLLDETSVVTAVLGIRPADFTRLIKACIAGSSPALSLANLIVLYRNISLAKALGLTVDDYLRVLKLIDDDPFQSFQRLIQFVEAVQFVLRNRFAFTFEEMDYLLRYTTDAEPTSLFAPAWSEQTLTDLRTNLQSVQKDLLNSAEPPAEHLRKMLAGLGWYPKLIEEAVDLIESKSQFEVRIPASTPPPVVRIPPSLKACVSYEASERKLVVSGTLSRTEWTKLSKANGNNVAPVKSGIKKLRAKVNAFVATLSQHQLRLQSFNLPTYRVAYKPQKTPVIPSEIGARCYYDQSTDEIVFVGWMTADEEQKLKEILPANILQGPNGLKTKSDQYQEQSRLNRFLSASDIEGLFLPDQTPESRFRFVLEKLAPWYYREAAVVLLSRAVGLEQAIVRDLLSNQLDHAQTLDALIHQDFVKYDARVLIKATSFPKQFQALGKLHKAALICTKLKLEPTVLSWLPPTQPQSSTSSVFDTLAFDELPIKPNDTRVKYVDWQSLLQLFELRDRPQVGPDLVANVLKYVNTKKKAELYSYVAEALRISKQDIADTADTQLKLQWPNDYLHPTRLSAFIELLLTIQKLGAKASEVFSLTKEAPGIDEAILARNLLRARSDASSWSEQLKPIVDILRERQRGALVAYLVAQDRLRDANDLYDRYLIDVEMGPCKVSTRILHAISAVQLFVQRCLMNLEEDVSPNSIDAERWKWMKNYRVWEANRKVFLYPENWIEPELRDNKSEIFKELEGQLLQNELDNDRAEEILKEYLKQLEDISGLAIVGMYVEKLAGNDSTGTTVHIIGRTRNRPSHFFYRRWVLSSTVNYWTPWERVPLDGVKTDHVLPFVMSSDVFIAWPEITQLPEETVSGDNKTAGPKWRLQMAWTRKTSRGWSERYLSQDTIEAPWVYEKDENETFSFRVRNSLLNSVEIDCYAAPREGDTVYTLPVEPATEHYDEVKFTNVDDLKSTYVTIWFSGFLRALYTEAGNKIYKPIPSAQVKVELLLADAAAKRDFTDKYYWWVSKNYDSLHPAYLDSSIMEVTGYTVASGYFSFYLRILAQALLRTEVLSTSPSFSLQVLTIPNDSSSTPPAPQIFPLQDAQDTRKFRDVRFHKNFTLPREGSSSGAGSGLSVAMKPIRTFKILAAEDAQIVPWSGAAQDDPLFVPNGTLAYASGYCAINVNQNAPLSLPSNTDSVSLWQGVASRYFLLPAFPADGQPPEVLVYNDSTSSYFIRKEVAELDPTSSQGKYQILIDGDPAAGALRRNVERMGIWKVLDLATLFDLDQESPPSPTVFDGHTATGVIDIGRSFTQPGIRFEPDEAKSPYASYNTELFFHMPFLIANYLSNNQRFEEAQHWFHLIFNPTTDDKTKENKRYWRYLPFRDHSETKPIDELMKLLADPQASENDKWDIRTQIQAWLENPFRPHAVARLRPRAYEFAVVFKYLDNLIAWADQLFQQSTTESINEATQLYILVAKLLGQRPRNIPRSIQAPALTYRSVAGNWDDFSNAWFEVEANLSQEFSGNGRKAISDGKHDFVFHTDKGSHSITSIGMLYFCVPGNEKMLSYWNTIEDRLFNIRHCRNIEGVEQQVPLFQPPIDPGLLVRAVAAGLDISTVLSDMNSPLPYYRFNVLVQKASELCSELKALGSALLSALEKKDAEQLSLLRSSQEIELLNLVEEVKKQQIEEAKTNLEALRQSEQLAFVRFMQYQKLLGKTNPQVPEDLGSDVEQTSMVKVSSTADSGELSRLGLTQAEQQQFEWSDAAIQYSRLAGAASTLGGIMHAIPQTHTGEGISVEFGGSHLGSICDSISALLHTLESNANHFASRVSTIGQYQRRQDEWVFQSRLALKEIGQIRKQIAAAKIRKAIAENELTNHKKQIKNAEDMDKFMRREKYTNQELYQWMVNQISGVYFQTYKLVFDVAKRAERAFRHELGVQNSSFIKFGYWDSLKKGLLAGDNLFHDLKRMEIAYLDQNKREYEITKHISLLQIDPTALITLRHTGTCELTIPESIFDLDFAGHYLRRIKMVSLTIPCVTGPYSGVPCTLTLLKSQIRISNSSSRDYKRDLENDDSRFIDLFGPIQSIVTSTGQNDSGLFEPNLRDERYLPFEGAGVISTWRIELPSGFPAFDYDTITDVVLHVRYTARNGGDVLKQKASGELLSAINPDEAAATEGMARMFSLRHEFPTEWHQLMSGANQNPAGDSLGFFAITKNRFPFLFGQRKIQISAVDLYAVPKSDAKSPEFPALTIKLPGGTSTMGAGVNIGQLLAKVMTPQNTLAVDAKEASARWEFKIPKASVAKFQRDIDDILMVCHYKLA